MGYIAKATSRAEIRGLARVIRKIQGTGRELYFPILDFVEKTLPRINPNFSFCVGTMKEMGECEGLTLPERREIVIREDVYEKAKAGDGRARLTVAHELYHYLRHSTDTVAFARTNKSGVPRYCDAEWQADAFGGELLVPYDLARNLSMNQIVENCVVSWPAAACQYRIMH